MEATSPPDESAKEEEKKTKKTRERKDKRAIQGMRAATGDILAIGGGEREREKLGFKKGFRWLNSKRERGWRRNAIEGKREGRRQTEMGWMGTFCGPRHLRTPN